jgi:broad specificity phosphatase PhoE
VFAKREFAKRGERKRLLRQIHTLTSNLSIHPPPPLNSLEWARQLGPGVDPSTLRIVASPFARTLETATLAGAAVGIGPAHASCFCTAEELVERNFGGFELQDHAHYVTVWEEDAKDLDWRPPGGGESVRDVAGRVSALFARLEAEFAGADAAAAASSPRRVLLVAHGDTLSIATAVARGADLGQHRAHAQETGELRRLVV